MKTQTFLIAGAIAALSACTGGQSDSTLSGVRGGPQSQSPIANSPGGKFPEGGATTSATPVVIINDGAATASGGSIFEFQG